jgi:ATP-dependent DNA helicase RecG
MAADLLPSPIPVQILLNPAQTESQRLEFKATWNEPIAGSVVKTACAFANDLYNLNGGYIVLGVEEKDGQPVLPPRGVDDLNLDKVQKELFGACKAIQPDYQPTVFVETYQDRRILILFCPGGDCRPYQAPDHRRKGSRGFFIRQGVQTVKAEDDSLRQLMEQANKIPWDDRRSLGRSVLDISPTLVRRHLHQVGSHLAEAKLPDEELYRKLGLVLPVNAHVEPRNIALLFFHNRPREFFPGARIELCEFPEGRGGNKLIERVFDGPLPEQIEHCQSILEERLGSMTFKSTTGSEAWRRVPYPLRALKELLVNAVYHRGYDNPEPIKVYVEPDCITISSYPGPHPKIQPEHFRPGNRIPETPARNRRIGELLKELTLAEARGSGFLKVRTALAENGSPPLEVDCDPTFFSVVIPIHADYAVLRAHILLLEGHRHAAQLTVERALQRQPGQPGLADMAVSMMLENGDRSAARRLVDQYIAAAADLVFPWPVLRFLWTLVTGKLKGIDHSFVVPQRHPAVHDEVCTYLAKVNAQCWKLVTDVCDASYLYWCVGELGEAIYHLEPFVEKYEWTLQLLVAIKLELATQSEPELAEQLLLESLDQLETKAHELKQLASESSTDNLNQSHIRLGEVSLRLAEVRQALGMSPRSVRTAVQQAYQYAQLAEDKRVLDQLHRLFPRHRA